MQLLSDGTNLPFHVHTKKVKTETELEQPRRSDCNLWSFFPLGGRVAGGAESFIHARRALY